MKASTRSLIHRLQSWAWRTTCDGVSRRRLARVLRRTKR